MQDTKYVWSETKSLIISPSFVSKHIGIALTDNTDIPFEVAEMIIAHKTGSKVARAYNQTDYLEQRRPYMEMWADFLDQGYKNVCS